MSTPYAIFATQKWKISITFSFIASMQKLSGWIGHMSVLIMLATPTFPFPWMIRNKPGIRLKTCLSMAQLTGNPLCLSAFGASGSLGTTMSLKKKRNYTPVDQTIARATKYYHVAVHHNDRKITTTTYIKREPPPSGSYKLNTDWAACPKVGVMGFGGVFRNNRGDWVLGYMKSISHTTSVGAELHACWYGLKIALEQKFIPPRD